MTLEAIHSPSTIMQPSTRTVLGGAKDYYVSALWSSSMCRQYSCIETLFMLIMNQLSYCRLLSLKQLNGFPASWIIHFWLTDLNKLCAKLACGTHFYFPNHVIWLTVDKSLRVAIISVTTVLWNSQCVTIWTVTQNLKWVSKYSWGACRSEFTRGKSFWRLLSHHPFLYFVL